MRTSNIEGVTMETRVALLELFQATTARTLSEMKADARAFEADTRASLASVRQQQTDDFRRLVIVALGYAGIGWLLCTILDRVILVS